MKEKNKKRVKIFFTIETELNEKFQEKITEKYIDKSLLLESLVKRWLKELEDSLI